MSLFTPASWTLRIAGLLALVIGLELWSGTGGVLVPVHMLLGVIAVVALWALAFLQARMPGGSKGLSAVAFVFGLLVPVAGIGQLSFLATGGRLLAQLVHVALAMAVIGLGEACAGRIRRAQVGGERTA